MEDSIYTQNLFKPYDADEVVSKSRIVFKEGHLDKIDDLIVSILPLANMIYYRFIKRLDDREYAKEDLISDAILRLYQDMNLRWDKYIYIDSYCEYYSSVLRHSMIGLVHGYHSFYAIDDIDPESVRSEKDTGASYDTVEMHMVLESINKQIIETAEHILRCRKVNTNLLVNILKLKYVDKTDVDSLRSRVRVLGISNALFSMYCDHVDYVYKLSYNYQYAILGGKGKMIDRIASTISRFEDVTYSMLSESYYDSIIPELYAEFGPEVAKKFVKTFSNRTIQVPNYRDFCDNLLGGVVLSLTGGDREELYRVADEYNMSYKSLQRIFNKAIEHSNNKK